MAVAEISIGSVRDLSDGDIIAGTVAGRLDGFEELVRRYQRPITGYVFRMVGEYESALDVTQEVFIKVYNSLHKYSPEYKFSTWLYRIAHNAAVDHLRRNSITPQSLEAENADGSFQIQIESRLSSPEQDRERSEWRTEIDSVVRALPPAYRDLIMLRHGQDLSYDEIAEVTGLPLGTVKNRLFRARELMREMFIARGFTGV
ncbi:MAG: sigma-70 family RNA polymerase sigma factor [Acidobacteria bacterium]|nr:sigma-70 family RNA polymerase sigma factor [Acidobacteriota bacterium]MBP7476485.1 sigma-70 family RNA polymerase sigma factor [Pyrinomonadaceae bacterium]MBP9108646.1 sigma-70 family RNA polymerase sigma factor [Pyrinomonadaceae bacterium]